MFVSATHVMGLPAGLSSLSSGGGGNPRKRSRSPSFSLPTLPARKQHSPFTHSSTSPTTPTTATAPSSSAPRSVRQQSGEAASGQSSPPLAPPTTVHPTLPSPIEPSHSVQHASRLPSIASRHSASSTADGVVPREGAGGRAAPSSEATSINHHRPTATQNITSHEHTPRFDRAMQTQNSSRDQKGADVPMDGVVSLSGRGGGGGEPSKVVTCTRCASLAIRCSRPPPPAGAEQPAAASSSSPPSQTSRPSQSGRCYGCIAVEAECILSEPIPAVLPVPAPRPPVAPAPHLPARPLNVQYSHRLPSPPETSTPITRRLQAPAIVASASAEERWAQERRLLMERVGWLEGEVGRLAEGQAKLVRAFEDRKNRKRTRLAAAVGAEEVTAAREEPMEGVQPITERLSPRPRGPSPTTSAPVVARAPSLPAPISSPVTTTPLVANSSRSSPAPPHALAPKPSLVPTSAPRRPNSTGPQTFTLPPSTTPLPSALAALPPAPFRRPAHPVNHHLHHRDERARHSHSPYSHPSHPPPPGPHPLGARRGSEILPGGGPQMLRDQPRRLSEHGPPPPPPPPPAAANGRRLSPPDLLHHLSSQPPSQPQHRSTPTSWFSGAPTAPHPPLVNPLPFSSSLASSTSTPPRNWSASGPPPPPPVSAGGWTSNTPRQVTPGSASVQRSGMSSPFAGAAGSDGTPRRPSGDAGPSSQRSSVAPSDFVTHTTAATPTPPPKRESLSPTSTLPPAARLPSPSAVTAAAAAAVPAPKPAGGHSIASLLAAAEGSMGGGVGRRKGSFGGAASGASTGVGGFRESSMRGGSATGQDDEEEDELEEEEGERGGDERGRVGGVRA